MTRPCGACGRPRQVRGGVTSPDFCRDCCIQRDSMNSPDVLEFGAWVVDGPIRRWVYEEERQDA